ncbi:hypothetical protein VIRA109638_13275 [Vibrio rarus]
MLLVVEKIQKNESPSNASISGIADSNYQIWLNYSAVSQKRQFQNVTSC